MFETMLNISLQWNISLIADTVQEVSFWKFHVYSLAFFSVIRYSEMFVQL